MNRSFFALLSYQLVILLLTPVLVLALIVRSFTQKAYRQRLAERFGLISKHFKSGGIIIHAASVGEVLAVRPFVERALKQWPHLPITVTTFTPTGSAQVKALFGEQVQHCYLPLDVSVFVNLFLKRLKPQAIVLMETELWPTLIDQAYQGSVKLQLINARLSAKSLKHYQKLTPLMRPLLAKFSYILAQSQDNAEHYLTLGAPSHTVVVSGNLKYDLQVSAQSAQLIDHLSQQILSERLIWVVGSTHPDDEDVILSVYPQLKQQFPSLLLVIVPRHPERFNKVAELIASEHLTLAKRSTHEKVRDDSDVWLIDTLGELLAVYALADVCTVGGSFSTVGGHNPLEPALFAKAIIAGPDMANFKEMNNLLLAKTGIVQLARVDELTTTLAKLLTDHAQRQALGQAALAVIKANQGATLESINCLANLLQDEQAAGNDR